MGLGQSPANYRVRVWESDKHPGFAHASFPRIVLLAQGGDFFGISFRNELPVISRLIWERCVRSPEPTRVSCEGVIEPQLFPDNNHLGMNRGGEIDHEVTDESVQFVQCREREPVVLIELISF